MQPVHSRQVKIWTATFERSPRFERFSEGFPTLPWGVVKKVNFDDSEKCRGNGFYGNAPRHSRAVPRSRRWFSTPSRRVRLGCICNRTPCLRDLRHPTSDQQRKSPHHTRLLMRSTVVQTGKLLWRRNCTPSITLPHDGQLSIVNHRLSCDIMSLYGLRGSTFGNDYRLSASGRVQRYPESRTSATSCSSAPCK